MKEIFNLLIKNGLSPNQFYLLIHLKEGLSPPLINFYTELRLLKLGLWVNEENKLTEKAYLTINDIEAQVKVIKKKTTAKVLGMNAEEFIDKYLEMWPKGRLPSGKLARAAKTVISSNFNWFFQNHKYSWDLVLKATAYYLDEYEKKSPAYMYMRTAAYFISKMDHSKVRISELADYCEIVLNPNTYEDSSSSFNEKVV